MSVSLSKGGKVSLTKQTPGLRSVAVALGWDEGPFDLDASAFMLEANGKVPNEEYFIFYNNLQSPDGSVTHTGDDLVGGGDDSEAINVELASVPPNVDRIAFPVTIYKAEVKGQHFGQVSNAFIRVINRDDDTEIARYDLVEDASGETAMVFGELYRAGAEWHFRAVGQGYTSGLSGICLDFGVKAE